MRKRAQVAVVGVEAVRPLAPRALDLGRSDRGLDRPDHVGRDPVLEVEHVLAGPVVPLGPEVPAGHGLDELGRDPHPLAGRADAALEHVADAELPADLAHVDRLALVGEARVAGDDEEALSRDSAVVMSSVMPSAKNSCSGSALMLSNGSTAIDGRSGSGQRGPFRRCAPLPPSQPVDPDGPLDVLELPLAEVLEVAAELALEVVVGRARDHHAARLGELLEAGGDVHPVAVEVAVGLADHVAEVDADPEADALLFGHARLALGHALLDQDGARAPRRRRSRTRRARRPP